MNSSVVVDIKLAFESDPLRNDRPRFASPASLMVGLSEEEAVDLWGKPDCGNQWCFDSACHQGNIYMATQFMGRITADNEIRPVLEEYEQIKLEGAEGLERFTALMEKHSLTQLLPGVVPGFALRNRKWVLLDLAFLREVKKRNEWKKLVLPKGHQEMVQAMVEAYSNDMTTTKNMKDGARIRMDLVSGKGEGCIILLHGVPGVGKTSTAECVAAHTNKPLYPITCGDIGVTPDDVESNMEQHFKPAHKWGCVLLLDEADVFLAKRDQRDVTRNVLVSVFLRILEYYSGILFLTTNRVGSIDDAFRSRLHLQLYYPNWTRKQTKQIFQKNFEQVESLNHDRLANGLQPFDCQNVQKKVIAWAQKNYDTLSWNGRQIRNGFQSVFALAEFGAKKKDLDNPNPNSTATQPKVTLELFKIVAATSLQFTKYLKETHGFDEDVLAQRERIRANQDEFSSKRSQPDEHRLEDLSYFDEDSSDVSDSEESSDEGGSDDSEEEDDEPKKKRNGKGKGKGGKNLKEGEIRSAKKGKKGKKGKKCKKDEEEEESESE